MQPTSVISTVPDAAEAGPLPAGRRPAVLAPPVLARHVAAILCPARLADDPAETGHMWRWKCGRCRVRSFATFLTAREAGRAGDGHICRGVEARS